MRACAVILSVGAVALSATGCGGDEDPAATSNSRTTATAAAPAKVTPADYALRAERRCTQMVAAQRRAEIAGRRYARDPTEITRRVFVRTYRDILSTSAEQIDRLARLTPPDGYAAFQRALRAGARIVGTLDRRVRRLLARDSSPTGILRVVRLVSRTSFDVPDGTLPAELAQGAPSCATVLGPEDGGGRVAPDTLQA